MASALRTLATSLFLFGSSFAVVGGAVVRMVLLLVTAISTQPIQPDHVKTYNDKVILILGASSGIGSDIALNAAAKGALLVLAARRLNKLEAVAEECLKLGASKVDIIQVDVSVEQQTKHCMETIKKLYNRLDILVLNAAIPGPWANVEDIKDYSMLYDIMSINYWGYVVPTLQALPLLSQSPQGHIIVVSSMYGHIISPYQAGYAAAKHAIHGYFDSFRLQLRYINHLSTSQRDKTSTSNSGSKSVKVTDSSIGVTIHCPGGIATEVLSKFQTADAQMKGFYIPNFLLGDSDHCARDILKAYENHVDEAFYPFYAQLFTQFRIIFPDVFDSCYHWITHFYTENGIFYFQ
eukprot:TRINITY_DN7996_c0_g1_i1.p1 TRINITY_DN7996_c0_g1~~TRINITY_DN7996_c0_g1_i1.p1  ORF type:complete len:383 (-),score=48.42 TRINITY_DN7996_c0_g1_i1:4-1053(-)